jgi:hypothetical protein
VQGYLFSTPKPAHEIAKMIAAAEAGIDAPRAAPSAA